MALPLRTNQILRDRGFRKPPPLELPAPPIYEVVKRLPSDAVLLELPIGAPAYDIRSVFYSTTHWRRLVNGYSGAQPVGYAQRAGALREVPAQSADAWAAIIASGATHVLVHEAAWRAPRGSAISAWLENRGASRLAAVDDGALFALPAD
jgi:hypothetical protein